jgi:hypothetical protein
VTQGTLPTSNAKAAQKIIEEILGNNLELLTELIGDAFSQSLDTGGIEPDAYVANLYRDWEEAVRDFGLPADDQTFLRYSYLRHFRLFEIQIDNFGNPVWSEKRIPPSLTTEENLSLIDEVRTDLEDLYSRKARLNPSGSFAYHDAPNDGTEPRESYDRTPVRAPARPGDVFGVPEVPATLVPATEPPTRIFLEPARPQEARVPRRKPLPSDVFGVPDTVPGKAAPNADRESVPREPSSRPTRPMRPDDPFGTPGTPIFREDAEPIIPVPSATGPSSPHTYSMSIRPGETKTQVIELPGLTLELVITMPGLYPRVA